MSERTAAVPAQGPANLADILERVLDKGIVIAGDIRVDLLDIELLTIRLRLIVVSVDKAKEMGIDWWESDPSLSSRARRAESVERNGDDIGRLAARVAELEKRTGPEEGTGPEEQAGPEERTGPRKRAGRQKRTGPEERQEESG